MIFSMKTNNKGFSLIEVIVVVVIVGILSAIAIPIYSGFVADAKQDSVNNLAETAAAAANTYVRKRGETTLTVTVLNLHYDNTKYTITINTGTDEVTVAGYGKTKTVSYQ